MGKYENQDIRKIIYQISGYPKPGINRCSDYTMFASEFFFFFLKEIKYWRELNLPRFSYSPFPSPRGNTISIQHANSVFLLCIILCMNNISARLCLQVKVYYSPKPCFPALASSLVSLMASFIRCTATSSELLFDFSLIESFQHIPSLLHAAARLIIKSIH